MKLRNIVRSLDLHVFACYLVAAAVSCLMGRVEGLSNHSLWACTIGAPLFLAYLLRFTFFYEVTREQKLRWTLGYVTLAAILIGLCLFSLGTVNILVGVVLGIIVPALTRRALNI